VNEQKINNGILCNSKNYYTYICVQTLTTTDNKLTHEQKNIALAFNIAHNVK